MIDNVKLPAPIIASLKKSRTAISNALAKADKVANSQTALEDQRDAVADEIEKLEKAKSITDRQTNALMVKREKLRQIDKRLSDFVAGGPEIAHLSAVLRGFNPIFHQAMMPVHEALTRKILTALRPFYYEKNLGPHLAQGTDAMNSLTNFLSNRFGMGTNPIANAKTALAILDKLLAGKNPWECK